MFSLVVIIEASAITLSLMTSTNKQQREQHITILLQEIVKSSVFDGAEAEQIESQYLKLCEDLTVIN